MFSTKRMHLLLGILLVLLFLWGSGAVGGGDDAQAQTEEPFLHAEINHDWVDGWHWPLGAISISIEDPGNLEPVYYAEGEVVPEGDTTFVNFNLGEAGFDLQPGHTVMLTSGDISKSHTVFYIEITDVNTSENTVEGLAEPDRDLWVTAHDPCWESVLVPADGDVHWTVTFTCDLNTVSGISVEQYGDNQTKTSFNWSPPPPPPEPFLHAEINHDWVDGWHWPLGLISITIHEPGNPYPVYDAEDEVVPEGDTTFVNFNLGEAGFDLQPGHTVTLTSGDISKSHTVFYIEITDVNTSENTVEGLAEPDRDLWVTAHDPCWENILVPADGDAHWTVTFTCNLDTVSGISAEQYGDNETMTSFNWSPPPSPSLEVGINYNWVEGRNWPLGLPVTLTIDDPDTPEPVDYSETKDVWEDEYSTIFVFDYWETGFDIEPGHEVTVSNGVIIKTHTAFNIGITGMDTSTNTVEGYADPKNKLWVFAHDPCGEGVPVTADDDGHWLASFGCALDEVGGFRAEKYGDNNTMTAFDWSPPSLQAEINHDWVDGWNWPAGHLVSLTIEEDGGPVYDGEVEVNVDTNVHFELGAEGFDVQPGHIITLSDGITTKTHTAFNIGITSVNIEANTVEGFAEADSEVWVYAHDPCWEGVPVRADVDGNWVAEFSCPLDGVDGINVEQYDTQTTFTSFHWSPPTLHVELNFNWVDAANWPLGLPLTLTIDDPGTEDPVDYLAVKDVTTEDCWQSTCANFDLWEGGYKIDGGHIVTITNGEMTMTYTARDLSITRVDYAAKTIEGYAEPGSMVSSSAHTPCWEDVDVVANSEGYWIAYFLCDLSSVEFVSADQYGPDVGTGTSFLVGKPLLGVDLFFDNVNSLGWLSGSEVTLTIDDPDTPGGEDYVDTQIVGANPEGGYDQVGFDFMGEYYVEPGHIITLSDGGMTIVYEAELLGVTRVDPEADVVEGFAEPGKELSVMVYDPYWVNLPVTADETTGEWVADFSGIVDLMPGSGGWATTSPEWADNHTTYSWRSPTPDEYRIGFWWEIETFSVNDEIVLRTGWSACTPNLIKQFQKAAHIDITINGVPLYPEGNESLYWAPAFSIELEGCTVVPDGRKASVAIWSYDLGSLEPGIHEIYIHYWLDHPVIDGGDWDGDGRMDLFEGTLVENTIIFVIK